MLLEPIKTIRNKYNGLMDGLMYKKEIFGDLKDDYIALYKLLTDNEDFVKEDYVMHVYHIGDFDGICHLFISADTDFIQHEIVRGTYCINSPSGERTEVEIEILMLTTPLQRHDAFLQIATERYFLEDIKYSSMMVDSYVHKLTKNLHKWNKIAITTTAAYAIAISHKIAGTTPLEATYYDLLPAIKNIMDDKPHPYTLDINSALNGVNLDFACSEAISKILKLETNTRSTNN